MRKVLRVISAIISLCFMTFLLLCTYSPLQPASAVPASPAEQTEPNSSPEPRQEISLPFVTPKVTLTAGSFPEDTQELTAQLFPGETALLAQFTQLKRADLSGSQNVDEIAAWAAANPQIEVRYTVPMPNGESVSSETTALDLSWVTPETVEQTIHQLKLLPKLKTLELGTVGAGGLQLSDMEPLRAALPEAELRYQVQLLGQTLGAETESVDLSSATPEQFAEALQVLGGLPNLKTIRLGAEGANITWENVLQLNEVCPNAVYDFAYSLYGVPTNLNAEAVNLSHVRVNDDGATVRNVMPLMHACTYVDMDSCGVNNYTMREIRDANPGIKFVWRIWFGTNYSVRTDVIKILASKPSVGGDITNGDVDALSCCTDLKYIDLGHNDLLTDCSFFYSMPNLEVAILTLTGINDISPLAACPHLEYLELTYCPVTDLSPLANAQELRHLNIGRMPVTDITPLYGLKDLERCYICLLHHVPQEQIDELRRLLPDCEVNDDLEDPSLGSWRYANLTDRGWVHYVETGYFLFDNVPRYDLLREQFGYDEQAYAFSWLDPLY